jgi:LPXTG-site transpeptidase (sortase) family protein
MRTGRLIEHCLALVIVLTLVACGSAPASAAEVPVVRPPHAVNAGPASTALQPRTVNTAADPMRLIIPSLGINAHVENVSFQQNGDMATPTLNPWEDVGWYEAGPHPSDHGSAVIDGHLDRPGGYPAVFWRLRQIQVGDVVLVENKGGKTLHFHVTRIALYAPQDAPIQDIFGNGGGTYLNLITCAGDWIPDQHQTNQRLVVYTVLN